jgi:hypothetical protein
LTSAGPEGLTVNWSAADFEQIALPEPRAQDDLLGHSRHRLDRCTISRELVQLTRSLTRAVSGFPWNPDAAKLHPVAGACNSCPRRSRHHPGLFDDQEPVEAPPRPSAPTGGGLRRGRPAFRAACRQAGTAADLARRPSGATLAAAPAEHVGA